MAQPSEPTATRRRRNPTDYAWLSIGAALVTIALKTTAYLLTDSIGLLSDAIESLVNLVAAGVVLVVLRIAMAPPDDEHEFGHGKVEYFSSGLEGALILVAAIAIIATAVPRLLVPRPLVDVGLGLGVSAAAAAVNLFVALRLRAAAREHHSISLEADSHHLMSDVWTSGAVIVGVALVAVTGWERVDPIIAIGVAVHILSIAWRLLRRSASGLMDTAVPAKDRALLLEVLARYERTDDIQWHALRTRQAGARRFVSVHVLVPGEWTVQRGHDLCERLELDLAATRSHTTVFTHLEPVEDERSFADQGLDRE